MVEIHHGLEVVVAFETVIDRADTITERFMRRWRGEPRAWWRRQVPTPGTWAR